MVACPFWWVISLFSAVDGIDHPAVLLLVFWYCHKRGKEVRLEKERQLTENEVAQLEKEHELEVSSSSEPPTTNAPAGASMEDVEAGMKEVEESRRTAVDSGGEPDLTSPSALSTTVQPAEQVGV